VPDTPRHVVAVVGGACSGAEAVDTLVSKGIHCVVLEQNDRPYGKIEDGLPKWHDKQRRQEYAKIDAKLDRPEVSFLPRTALGKDVDFADLARNWGFSAVLLANGSWRDRSSGVAGSDEVLGRGFLYQNPFIYWFNHHEEKGYAGERYDAADGAIVLGGGLASIDVAKVLMLETVAARLRARGIACDVVEMEHEGLKEVLARHGTSLADLGLKGCTLLYRRSVGEMPVAAARDDSAAEKERAAKVREKLIALSTEKYLYSVRPHSVARRLVLDNDRVVGLEVARTEYRDRKLVTVEGTEETLRTPLVISSIGSIPMPVPGIPMDGEFYKYEDWNVGKLEGYPGVYALGNVVTGKGNIAVSRKHGKFVAEHVIASYLGVAGPGEKVDALAAASERIADARREQAGRVASIVKERPPLSADAVASLRARVAERQKALGYAGYREWIAKVTPPDLK
jgi:NADPH-dependent glutamate synthase beta subunit-like oxidoreductase